MIPNSKGTGIDRWENYAENNSNILLNMKNNEIEKFRGSTVVGVL